MAGFSFLNGISAMGAGMAQFAGNIGLDMQKAQLIEQQTRLADQLATTREQTVTQPFQAGLQAERIGSEERRSTAELESAERRTTATTGATLEAARMSAESAQKVAGIEASAAGTRLASQLSAAAKEVNIDANTGTAVQLDKMTGKVTPIMGADGNPLRLPNPELAKGITATMNQANEELRNLNTQRSSDLRAAQDQLDRASQRTDVMGPEKDAAIAAAQKNVKAVQDQYAPGIAALQARLAQYSSSLLRMAPGGDQSGAGGGASGNRPPLGNFYGTGAPDTGIQRGLINGAVPQS